MKRKITILTIAFLSSVLMCANVFAAASGPCGYSIKWTLDDSGNLTLSGSGEMWNYSYYVPFFKDYVIKTVTIGDGITSIGDDVFDKEQVFKCNVFDVSVHIRVVENFVNVLLVLGTCHYNFNFV